MEKELVGEGVGFERIRRITGYLVGSIERFNDAKKAEVNDRVVHDLDNSEEQEALEGFAEWIQEREQDDYDNNHLDFGEEE